MPRPPSRWDVVDSTADQVYGGYSGETSPESAAALATAGQYISYGGRAAFTQYGSANGGWTSAGSQPYLPAKPDPYDGVLKGTSNWGHAWSTTRVRDDDPAEVALGRDAEDARGRQA